MDVSSALFYIIAAVTIFSALSVLLNPNPVMSALFLAVTMMSLAGSFYMLGAHFIAGVQLMVYAGAVLILFVMVLMLFDLSTEKEAFAEGAFTGAIKWLCGGTFVGLLSYSIFYSADMIMGRPEVSIQRIAGSSESTKVLAKLLFTDYIVSFEILGVILLVVAIGVVSISRIQGGTHADD